MSKSLKNIKERFIKTMGDISHLTGFTVPEICREIYIRVAVDTGMPGRLNKEELNLLGGFRLAKQNYFKPENLNKEITQPNILVFDIETAPIIGYVWGLWDNNVGLNQIKSDWYVLSWSAKWLHEGPEKVMYQDQRKEKNIEDDSKLLKQIWNLLDKADVVITQNGVKFDVKKLNARFMLNGFKPPSSYRHIDTLQLARRHFAFTSNKLAYMTDKLCTKYKKLDHAKFSGFEMWKECMAGNLEAWKEMELYNKYDVLSLEELYFKLIPWDNSIDFNLYHDIDMYICKCGSTDFKKSGLFVNITGKFQKYKCTTCGSETRDTINLLSDTKRKSLRRKV